MIMSLIRNKKISLLIILSIFFLNCFIFLNCEPLTKEVLEYLEKDEETFKSYKANYKNLACKVLTYSRIKYLYEKEEIDKYINQTQNRRGFVDYLQESIFNMCTDKYSDLNMEVFEPSQFVAWNTQNDQWVNVNLTNLLANYTLIENSGKEKSDL